MGLGTVAALIKAMTKKTDTELAQVKTDITKQNDVDNNIKTRQQNVDGLYYLPPSDFEIGNLSYSSSGWSYPTGNTTKIRPAGACGQDLKVCFLMDLRFIPRP